MRQLRRRCCLYQAGGELRKARFTSAAAAAVERVKLVIEPYSVQFTLHLLTAVRQLLVQVRLVGCLGTGQMRLQLIEQFVQLLSILGDAAQLLLLKVRIDLLAQQYLTDDVAQIRGCRASGC